MSNLPLHRGEETAVETLEGKGSPKLRWATADDAQGIVPIRERVAVTANVAAQFTGISRTRIYEFLQDGLLEGRIIRGRRLVLVESLLRLIGESPSTTRSRAA